MKNRVNRLVSIYPGKSLSSRPEPPERRFAKKRREAVLEVDLLEDRKLLSTFTVTSLADNGVGSGNSGDLRYVLILANRLNTGTSGAPDLISFSGVAITPTDHTIAIGSGAAEARPLPDLTDIAIIDGTSAVGFDNATGTLLELDGSRLHGTAANGLTIEGGHSTVQGLEIENFPGNGILVTSSHNTIGGDEVGVDSNGQPNGPTGHITDQFPTGTTTPVFVRPPLGNIISGNGGDGVLIQGPKAQFNLLEGNFIGTDVTGTEADGNRGNGVEILSANNNSLFGTTPIDQNNPFVFYNVISGNRKNGLLINDSNATKVYANFFGLGSDNQTPVGNGLDGVLINGTSDRTTFGANIPLGNVTAANGKNGLEIAGSASRTLSVNTFAGIAAFNPSALVGNQGDGILVTSDGGGKSFGKSGSSTIILTCQTSGNQGDGIEIGGRAKGVQVSQSVVGLQTNGVSPEPNQEDGIAIDGNASGVSIGGFEPSVAGVAEGLGFLEAANLISGNLGHGIAIQGSQVRNIKVVNSFVGTQIDGTDPAGNALDGIEIDGASNVQIGPVAGSSTAKDRNVIAFNGQHGVAIQQGNQDRIFGSSIYANGKVGIALGAGADQNEPTTTLISATLNTANSRTQVRGNLSGTAETTYQVEIFASTTSSPGNGQEFLGFREVRTDSHGFAQFSIGGLINPDPTQNLEITSTATAITSSAKSCHTHTIPDGNTSQFSKAISMTS